MGVRGFVINFFASVSAWSLLFSHYCFKPWHIYIMKWSLIISTRCFNSRFFFQLLPSFPLSHTAFFHYRQCCGKMFILFIFYTKLLFNWNFSFLFIEKQFSFLLSSVVFFFSIQTPTTRRRKPRSREMFFHFWNGNPWCFVGVFFTSCLTIKR